MNIEGCFIFNPSIAISGNNKQTETFICWQCTWIQMHNHIKPYD